ncbi:MAG: hypothetical protein OSJ22_07730, partial [Rikenellaceae bacterium]|nr:hypothetical protein [Rikenellaceae bacterium]
NAGTISSGMTATSSQTWCTVSVNGNKVTVRATVNPKAAKRVANVYVTYKNCKSNIFQVAQAASVTETVYIGGLHWCIYNLANPFFDSNGNPLTGSFATKLPSQCTGGRTESHGKFYQWNRNVAWNTTSYYISGAEPVPSGSKWQTEIPSGNDWTVSPCPSGFRVPTIIEYRNLINACTATYGEAGWSGSNLGYLTLTDNTDSSNKLEFPAVGRRITGTGNMNDGSKAGRYWSSSSNNTEEVSRLDFYEGSVNAASPSKKLDGFNVRCVRK